VVLSTLLVLAAVAGVGFIPPVAAQQPGTAGGGGERATATFNQTTISEDRGDIAAIGVNLSGTATATVTIGSNAVNYETHVTINDSNDDGHVTLLMNTYIAGTGQNESNVYATAAEVDDVLDTNRTTGRLNAPLDTSTYNLSVAVGDRRTDTATLNLTERTTDELITWTAPAASFDNITNASAVAVAVEHGRITTTDSVAVGDMLVNQFKLSGVYGALAASNFTQLVERGALNLTVVQTNPETNRRPKRLKVMKSLTNGSIRVIPDEQNDVLYVNIDTGEAAFANGQPMAGDEFEVMLTVNGESDLAKTDQSVSANVTLIGTELSLGEVSLTAAANQTVTGTTSVAPGSEVTVRLQRNGSGSFVKTNTTTVEPNGSFAAEFNLTETAPNTTVSVVADGPHNTSDRTRTTIQPSRSNESVNATASLTVADQASTGRTVTVKNVTLPAGGFVVVHAPNASAAPIESVLGASSYLKNGTNKNVTITLTEPVNESTRLVVMAHRDTNDNRVYDFSSSNGTADRPYTADGNPVTESIRLTVQNTTQATTDTRTANASPSTTGRTATSETTSGNGPGFGLLLAILGVLLAGLAAWRGR
jgi:hypothetical protein